MLDLFFLYDSWTLFFHAQLDVNCVSLYSVVNAAALTTWPTFLYHAAVAGDCLLFYESWKFFYFGVGACCCSLFWYARCRKFFIYEQLALQLNFSLQTEFLSLICVFECIWFNIFSFCCVEACNFSDLTGMTKILSEAVTYIFVTHGVEFFSFYSVTTRNALSHFIYLFIQENLLQVNIWLRLSLLVLRFLCYQFMDDALCLFNDSAVYFLPIAAAATNFAAIYCQLLHFYFLCCKFLFELDLIFKFLLLLNISYVLLLVLQRFSAVDFE